MSYRICSTSSTSAKLLVSLSSSRQAILVMYRPLTAFSAVCTCCQSRRIMFSTDSTANACTLRAYSVINRILSPVSGLHPATAGRSITGITWSRIFTMPNSGAFMPAGRVNVGIGTISRSLKTLMPNSSDFCSSTDLPRRNSSSSKRLDKVRLVLSSISF